MKCELDKVVTIFGHEARGTKVIAYCHYHHAWMTLPEVTRKQCVQKGCNRLSKCEDNPYWQQRERKKKRKQMKKEAGIPVYEKVIMRTNHNGEIIGIEKEKGGHR